LILLFNRLSAGGNKEIRLLINATKSIERLRAEEYWGERFFHIADPDKIVMKKSKRKLRRVWNTIDSKGGKKQEVKRAVCEFCNPRCRFLV